MDAAVVVAVDNDLIVAHLPGHIVAGVRDFGLVPDIQPHLVEDPLDLQFVDLGIREDVLTDEPLFLVDPLIHGDVPVQTGHAASFVLCSTQVAHANVAPVYRANTSSPCSSEGSPAKSTVP